MEHPIETTVQLSKEEKFKQLNDKLNNMLKNKKVDPARLDQTQQKQDNTVEKQERQDNNAEKQERQDNNAEKQENSTEKQERQEKQEKSRMIKKDEKPKVKVMRKVAGEVWEDKTMDDWPDNDYRIFCGNLGKEVSDEILGSVFRRYASFQMARVVRDRRTGKTRGYGFVSLTNPTDFLKALKEMNGKHVGNRPVKLTKSSWKDRDLNSQKNKFLPSDFKKNAQKTTHEICLDYKYVSSL